jgi:hypothetical protein
LQLSNTPNKDALCQEFRGLRDMVRSEREEWLARRKKLLKPEMFGGVMHIEFRP